jgi:hypothetical protein
MSSGPPDGGTLLGASAAGAGAGAGADPRAAPAAPRPQTPPPPQAQAAAGPGAPPPEQQQLPQQQTQQPPAPPAPQQQQAPPPPLAQRPPPAPSPPPPSLQQQLLQQQQQQAAQAAAAAAQRQRRRCAEVCNELLTLEAVASFTSRQYGPAAPAALEAVGFRVGRQLAERCVAGLSGGAPTAGVGGARAGPRARPRSGGGAQARGAPLTCTPAQPTCPHSLLSPNTFSHALPAPPVTRPQVQPGQGAPGRHPGGHEVPVQGLLAGAVQEAGGQPQD